MTALNTLFNLLNAEIKISFKPPLGEESDPVRAPDAPVTSDEGMQELTIPGYEERVINRKSRNTLELRYTPYGEFSTMVAMHAYAWHNSASRPGNGSPNAVCMAIKYVKEPVSSATLVFDGEAGLFAEKLFSDEIAQLRAKAGRMICEVSGLSLSRTLRSRRVVASMFHIAYIYTRLSRQVTEIVLQTPMKHASQFEKMLGFTRLAERNGVCLMRISTDEMKRRIRDFGGNTAHADQQGAGIYPFFFRQKDEAGLLYRFLEHLGTGNNFAQPLSA